MWQRGSSRRRSSASSRLQASMFFAGGRNSRAAISSSTASGFIPWIVSDRVLADLDILPLPRLVATGTHSFGPRKCGARSRGRVRGALVGSPSSSTTAACVCRPAGRCVEASGPLGRRSARRRQATSDRLPHLDRPGGRSKAPHIHRAARGERGRTCSSRCLGGQHEKAPAHCLGLADPAGGLGSTRGSGVPIASRSGDGHCLFLAPGLATSWPPDTRRRVIPITAPRSAAAIDSPQFSTQPPVAASGRQRNGLFGDTKTR